MFVKALLSATRRMTSNGAMTCSILRHIGQSQLWESTNLGLREDGYEDTRNGILNAPRSNNQHRAHSVKGTRLDEHGDDGLAQPIDSSHPHGIASVPGVQYEPDDYHKGEEDVERK